jgi:Toastrack DUF4097
MKRLALAGCLLALFAAAPAHADVWSKQYPIAAKADLRISADDGNIQMTSWDRKMIEVRVSTTDWQIGSKGVRIEESQVGDRLEIEVHVPRMSFHLFGGRHHSIQIELRVPRQADADLHTGDGYIRAGALEGRIRLDTGDGHITAERLQGRITLHTGDGRIEGNGMDGEVDADSGDGRIDLRGRFEALHLHSGDGSIEATAESGSKMASDWTLHSGDGNITIALPDGFQANLDAHAGDGHISIDFPVAVMGRLSSSAVHGEMNGGGRTLQLDTGDGSIRIAHI